MQISQEAGQVVWYSHLFQNFSEFTVIQTLKGFRIVNKAEIDVFLELSCFPYDPADVGNLVSGSSAFSKTSHSLLQGIFPTHDQTQVSCIAGGFFTNWAIREALKILMLSQKSHIQKCL